MARDAKLITHEIMTTCLTDDSLLYPLTCPPVSGYV